MIKRLHPLLLIGVVMAVIGIALFFSPFESTAVWFLTIIFFYLGGSLAFIGASIQFFG